MKYSHCDHVCPVHPRVEYEILGAVPPYEEVYEKAPPETKAIFDRMAESVAEFKRQIKESRP